MHHEGHEDDEKGMGQCCDNCGSCGNCGCGGGHGHGGKGKLYMLVGFVAIVYGIVNYLITVAGWPGYQAWIFGGILLLIVGWAKKHMMKY